MHDADPENPEPPPRRAATRDAADAPAIELVDATGWLSSEDLAWLDRHARAALAELNTTGEARVRLIADDAMRRAHLDWLGDDSTTDVMTFDLTEGHAALTRALDTDLLVCLDEARRQAAQRGHEPRVELLLYIVHGVLHCLGHDDHDEHDAAQMHETEDRTLDAIGVGPVYARTAAAPQREDAR